MCRHGAQSMGQVKNSQNQALVIDSSTLRVALEALYLDKGGGEISFRLATYGAWHTGEKNFRPHVKERYENTSQSIQRCLASCAC